MADFFGILLLGAVGLFLSAFFSGSEIGFYRVTRSRLMLEALDGDRVARRLLHLVNHPSWFVATTLVGNNVANYMTSLAVVMAVQNWIGGGHVSELIAPLVLAPFLFVYGELLPKQLYLGAPNRLLRRGAALFFFFLVLFAPVSFALWAFNRGLAKLTGESPERIRLRLARRELQRILEEGREAGILYASQQALAHAFFSKEKTTAERLAVPLRDIPLARLEMSRGDILRLARRYRMPVLPVENREGRIDGCVALVEVSVLDRPWEELVRPLPTVPPEAPLLAVLSSIRNAQTELLGVVDKKGCPTGVITMERLRTHLFRFG